jgi:hypothetical protein
VFYQEQKGPLEHKLPKRGQQRVAEAASLRLIKKCMSSFFSEHCNILWYILFHLLLSWMKTNIQSAYITFINALETQEDNTMEKTGNSLSKNNAMEHHINQNFMSAQSLFQNNSFEGELNSISPPKFIYCFRVVMSRGSFGFGSWRLVGPLVKLLNI